MRLIVGLGNPGLRYAHTRHNIGADVVANLAKEHRIVFKRDRMTKSFEGRGTIDGNEVLLALPLTYMNCSGEAARALVKKSKVSLHDLLVVCDDLDLAFGRMKIKAKGSSAGHNGVASIIAALNSDEFARLRIGIGRPSDKVETSDFVLSRFTRSEAKEVGILKDKAKSCCVAWVSGGITKCMDTFNVRE